MLVQETKLQLQVVSERAQVDQGLKLLFMFGKRNAYLSTPACKVINPAFGMSSAPGPLLLGDQPRAAATALQETCHTNSSTANTTCSKVIWGQQTDMQEIPLNVVELSAYTTSLTAAM